MVANRDKRFSIGYLANSFDGFLTELPRPIEEPKIRRAFRPERGKNFHVPSSSHHAVFEELKRLTCKELKSSELMKDLLATKLSLVSERSVVSLEGYNDLQKLATLFIEIIQDVLRDRYQDLTIRCFAHLCVALDYLLDPEDSILDTSPSGHTDDREFLRKTADKFKSEIEDYQVWKEKTGSKW